MHNCLIKICKDFDIIKDFSSYFKDLEFSKVINDLEKAIAWMASRQGRTYGSIAAQLKRFL